MSDYSQVNETSYYFANSIVTPQTYSNMNNSYSVPQSFQNSAYYKFKYVNGAERGSSDDRPTPTKPAKVFKAAVPNKTERQDLKITEGSQGLKFARIARAIDQIQSDLKCPYTQYFDGEKCIDYPENTQVCPANQYYEPLYNKCMDNSNKEADGINTVNTLMSTLVVLSDRNNRLMERVDVIEPMINTLNERLSSLENKSYTTIDQPCEYNCGVDYNDCNIIQNYGDGMCKFIVGPRKQT